MEKDTLSYLPLLPLRVDAIGVTHPAARQVLEPLVGVESSPVLTYLGEPRPHLFYGRVHGDRPRGLDRRIWHQLVARQRILYFLLCGAPPQVPGADKEGIHPGERRTQDSKRSEQAGNRPLPVSEHPTAHYGPGAEHRAKAQE